MPSLGNAMSLFLAPNFTPHYALLEGQLKTVPDGSDYLCGKDHTVAEMMSFPLEAGRTRSGLSKTDGPLRRMDRLHQRDAYKRFLQKAAEVEGSLMKLVGGTAGRAKRGFGAI